MSVTLARFGFVVAPGGGWTEKSTVKTPRAAVKTLVQLQKNRSPVKVTFFFNSFINYELIQYDQRGNLKSDLVIEIAALRDEKTELEEALKEAEVKAAAAEAERAGAEAASALKRKNKNKKRNERSKKAKRAYFYIDPTPDPDFNANP